MARHKKENARRKQFRIRMTEEEYKFLNNLSKATRRSKTSILIGGLYTAYDGLTWEELDRFILYDAEDLYWKQKKEGQVHES